MYARCQICAKATLDVLINEYGKTTLPYASKSGGERCKASSEYSRSEK